jgi:hypothetical protein
MFGGYTKLEYDNLAATIDGWRSRALASETTVELVKGILAKEQERSAKLTESLYNRVITPAHPTNPPDMKPVGNTLSSWPRMKRELEKKHRVKDNAEVSREEIERTIREG